MTYTALLVEDEAPARRRLARLLAAHADVLRVVGEAADAPAALAAVHQHHPDVLFLDIELPGGSGFELLARLDGPERPHVVFVTAYATYAVQAFEARALDYLLKPVEPERLARAVAALHERRAAPRWTTDAVDALAEALRPRPTATTLPVRAGDRYTFVALADVTHLEARDKYVFVHTADGREHLVDVPLATLADRLPDAFVQVHRGWIIHRPYLAGAAKLFGGKYRLRLATRPPVDVDTGPTFADRVEALLTL